MHIPDYLYDAFLQDGKGEIVQYDKSTDTGEILFNGSALTFTKSQVQWPSLTSGSLRWLQGKAPIYPSPVSVGTQEGRILIWDEEKLTAACFPYRLVSRSGAEPLVHPKFGARGPKPKYRILWKGTGVKSPHLRRYELKDVGSFAIYFEQFDSYSSVWRKVPDPR